jgi:uncharacterized Zn finger protein (UPF0148 family)
MDCTHPVLYARNGGLYCQICGTVIDPPKDEKPLEGATEAVTEAKEKKPRRTRKKAD